MAKHGKVKDSGAYFVIDPVSRKVIVPHVHKSIGTVGDHNSEQITFECPQMIDSHDISQCESRYVTWINVNGEVGHDELHIEQVEQSAEGTIYLSWTIRNALTVAKGVVQFSVHFEDKDGSGATLYRWSTATCKDCDILDSINAVLGAYEAVYVAGNKLVFGDYNVVKDGVLKLETNGLIPEGTLYIDENGSYDVGKFAEVKVNVIGDPNIIPENIKKGVNIFGVTGTYDQLPLVSGTIRIVGEVALQIYYSGCSDGSSEIALANTTIVAHNHSIDLRAVKGSLITIKPIISNSDVSGDGVLFYIRHGAELLEMAKDCFYVITPTSDFNVEIVVSDEILG